MERGGSAGFLPPFAHFATQAIHAGHEPEQWRSAAVVPPISLSTTFKQQAPGQHAVSAAGAPVRPYPGGSGGGGRQRGVRPGPAGCPWCSGEAAGPGRGGDSRFATRGDIFPCPTSCKKLQASFFLSVGWFARIWSLS